jgi:succinyl-diaminopimelate desuccinylase
MPNVRARLAESCLELLRIPSVTGNEKEICDHLERWALAQRGVGRDELVRLGNSLIVQFGGQYEETKPCIALVGHTDTVPPSGAGDAGPRLDGDKLYGLGASDMKGGLSVMQVLTETLDLENLPFALVLIFYEREEGPYLENGLGPLLEANEWLRDVDLAVCMEPTDNTLQLGCMGSIQARLTFKGRAAHSARPWQGDNAIHKAGPLLAQLNSRPPREIEVQGLTFKEAMTVTGARGGHARNVVPDRFELNVNYRFAPTGGIDAAVQAARAEIHRLAGEAEVEILDVAPPGPVPVDNPILEHLLAHASLTVQPKQAWTDVARLAAFGIDAINFGPGATGQAHQSGEWASLDALVHAYDVLARTLAAPLDGM